jgi:ribose transport system substrate-binding protein
MNETTRADRTGRRLRWSVLAVGVVLVMGLAAACGDDDEGDASSAAAEASSAVASAVDNAQSQAESVQSQAESVASEVESAVDSAVSEATDTAAEATDTAAEATDTAAEGTDTAASDVPPAPAVNDDYSVTLKDGSTFQLADSIKKKVEAGEAINYVLSIQSTAIQGFSQQYEAGFKNTQEEAEGIYGDMNFKLIGPAVPTGDLAQQISQIKALADTDQIDCLSIEPTNSDGLTQITNELMAKGIPVFTVGVTTNGNEFTNFTQVPDKEGHTAAQAVLDYMNANGLTFDTFAVSGGDPTQFWAQGRMKGFREGILEAIPDAKFVTTESDPLSVTYEAPKTLDAYKAFLSGAGKDVDVIENVDIGAGYAARALDEAGKKGQAFSVGWNVTPEQVEAIRNDLQIALFDQKWPEQAGFGALACADYFKNKTIRPNTQELTVVTKDNLDATLAEQEKLVGGG